MFRVIDSTVVKYLRVCFFLVNVSELENIYKMHIGLFVARKLDLSS